MYGPSSTSVFLYRGSGILKVTKNEEREELEEYLKLVKKNVDFSVFMQRLSLIDSNIVYSLKYQNDRALFITYSKMFF